MKHRVGETCASYHLGFFLFLLYCTEETLLLLFFGWLWGVQHNSVGTGPENNTHRSEHHLFMLEHRMKWAEWNSIRQQKEWQIKLKSELSAAMRRGNYQGSNPGWRLEWLVTPSEESPELRLWPLLSWKELSGRGEGTVGQNTRQRLSVWETRNEQKGFNSFSLSPWSRVSSCVCFVRKCNEYLVRNLVSENTALFNCCVTWA